MFSAEEFQWDWTSIFKVFSTSRYTFNEHQPILSKHGVSRIISTGITSDGNSATILTNDRKNSVQQMRYDSGSVKLLWMNTVLFCTESWSWKTNADLNVRCNVRHTMIKCKQTFRWQLTKNAEGATLFSSIFGTGLIFLTYLCMHASVCLLTQTRCCYGVLFVVVFTCEFV